MTGKIIFAKQHPQNFSGILPKANTPKSKSKS
jgi:hypothetical protein